jgi:hypothetical protein
MKSTNWNLEERVNQGSGFLVGIVTKGRLRISKTLQICYS